MPRPRSSGSTAGNTKALARLSSSESQAMPPPTIRSPSKSRARRRARPGGARAARPPSPRRPEGVPGAAVLHLGTPADLVETTDLLVVDVDRADLHAAGTSGRPEGRPSPGLLPSCCTSSCGSPAPLTDRVVGAAQRRRHGDERRGVRRRLRQAARVAGHRRRRPRGRQPGGRRAARARPAPRRLDHDLRARDAPVRRRRRGREGGARASPTTGSSGTWWRTGSAPRACCPGRSWLPDPGHPDRRGRPAARPADPDHRRDGRRPGVLPGRRDLPGAGPAAARRSCRRR